MIELDLTEFFAVLLVAIAVLAGLSVAWDRFHDRKMAKAVRRGTIRCRICGAHYRRDARRGQALHSCPECGSKNREGRDRRLG